MEQILNILARADAQLEQIPVKGSDVYLMVNARGLLKKAFDMLNQSKPEEVVDDG